MHNKEKTLLYYAYSHTKIRYISVRTDRKQTNGEGRHGCLVVCIVGASDNQHHHPIYNYRERGRGYRLKSFFLI